MNFTDPRAERNLVHPQSLESIRGCPWFSYGHKGQHLFQGIGAEDRLLVVERVHSFDQIADGEDKTTACPRTGPDRAAWDFGHVLDRAVFDKRCPAIDLHACYWLIPAMTPGG